MNDKIEGSSLLDDIKARLTQWRDPAPQILAVENSQLEAAVPDSTTRAISWPWLTLLSFTLALTAQISLEPGPERSWTIGATLYIISAACLVVANRRGEWVPAALPGMEERTDSLIFRGYGALAAALLAGLAYTTFGGNRFTSLNTALWLLAIASAIWAFWLPGTREESWLVKTREFISRGEWQISITPSLLAPIAAVILILFIRVYRIDQVPPEMFSDQAEKLLDVWDVLHGETRIFFPRNTGREALQMYLTAGIIRLFSTGYSFLSLKIGTVLAGLLTLPFVYLLGKEVGNRRIGMLAAVFAGIAYWPNVISRVGLRFPLYPLFVAPTLYFLLRGIRTSNRNDFILSGLFLGSGLHGYTPTRILPIIVVIAVGIFLLHRQSRGVRRQTLVFLVILALVALVVFLPLLRYSVTNPEGFSFRSFSRLGTIERPLPGPAWQIFLQNLWDALTMFAWDNGGIWVVSGMNRPALDVVSGALFFSGVILLFVRYLQRRHWLDLFLLLSVPLLMLPSILSLAYPEENPALNRLSGAMVTMFIIVAIAADSLMSTLSSRFGEPLGPKVAQGFGITCILLASLQNYGLVFIDYQRVFEQSAWNTSEMGQVIGQFTTSVGSDETAWVLAYPHWVDTRLVGINAGYPLKDYAIWPEEYSETQTEPRAKLFLINPNDEEGLRALQSIYPQGVLQVYESRVESHNFFMFFVPPEN